MATIMNPRNQIDFMLPSQAPLVLRNVVPRTDLTLDQCILPKTHETLNLFAPHLQTELAKRGLSELQIELAFRYRETDLWDVLRDILPTCPVLLNRQPTQKLLDWLVLSPSLGCSGIECSTATGYAMASDPLTIYCPFLGFRHVSSI
jgi:hypothetical protein